MPETIDIQFLKDNKLIVFECISGSKAYGLDLPHSDTDIKGVFILPKDIFYSLDYIPQVSNESNDEVYYELRRFFELLAKNNPTLLEMLGTPEENILYRHPIFEEVKPEIFLSKLCKETFAGYAAAQIKKARGLNKKIVNPIAPERKTILDFCYVPYKQGAVKVQEWINLQSKKQENCGLVKIPHMPNVYHLFYDETGELGYKGIMRKDNSNDISLSSVDKNAIPLTVMTFNLDGYTKYCGDYKNYWDWVEKRNNERYQNTISHGKNYDAKNMMHTFRLLDMAEEIALHRKIIVKRPNREHLLKIRAGEFEYEALVQEAEIKLQKIENFYKERDLQEVPDYNKINDLLVKIRSGFYSESPI